MNRGESALAYSGHPNEYEDGRTAEFSIDQWTLSLGDYAARIIARHRQEKGDLPTGEIRAVGRSRLLE